MLAAPRMAAWRWAGPGLPHGGSQVDSQQWPLGRDPMVLGADHAWAQCGGAGQARGRDSHGCRLAGSWEGSGARQRG